MKIQYLFLKYLRFNRGFLACDEVMSYRCIADVLAVDARKKHVLEYEFKKTSHDLKVLEKRKEKYQDGFGYKDICGKRWIMDNVKFPVPHRFFYVIPWELWEKEQEYLEGQDCGVIVYSKSTCITVGYDFWTVKKCKLRKKNLQKYDVAIRDILARCSSAYVNLIKKASEAV